MSTSVFYFGRNCSETKICKSVWLQEFISGYASGGRGKNGLLSFTEIF